MTRAQHAPKDISAQSVTLMARVPASLAQEVQAYAATHQLPISALVRAGLTYVLTQPPPVEVAVPLSAPRPTPVRRLRRTLGSRILEVLAEAPDGLSVDKIYWILWTAPRRRRAGERSKDLKQQVGGTLRSLYRQGRIQRLSHGVYAFSHTGHGAA